MVTHGLTVKLLAVDCVDVLLDVDFVPLLDVDCVLLSLCGS